MIITAVVIEDVQREAGASVYVGHFYWLAQRHNQGFNVLCHGEGAEWSDEVPLDTLAGKDVPAAASGYVVLSCDTGGYAVVDPKGRFLGMRATMPDVLALTGP